MPALTKRIPGLGARLITIKAARANGHTIKDMEELREDNDKPREKILEEVTDVHQNCL